MPTPSLRGPGDSQLPEPNRPVDAFGVAGSQLESVLKVERVPKSTSSVHGPELRKTVYRILRFEHLVRLFRDRQFSLTSPFSWEDPFERLWSRLVFPAKADHELVARRVFGSCLTFQARSDAMWTIYSRNWLGVRVTMKLDVVQRQMESAPELTDARVWIGEVNYLSDTGLTTRARELKAAVALPGVDHSEVMAKAWLNKRIAFRHEDELRLLLVLPANRVMPVESKTLKFAVDPHELISSIHIDPRAPREVFETLERDIRSSLGFKGSVKHSSLFRLPKNLELMLEGK